MMVEVEVSPLSWKRKEMARSDQRVAYKYPQARRFIADLMTTYTPGELQDLLAVGVEFPELGMVKIETKHPIPGLDQLCVTLEARRSTGFDVSAFVAEEYVEEIDLDTFIQAMLTRQALEPSMTISLGLILKQFWVLKLLAFRRPLASIRARGFTSLPPKRPRQ